MYLTLKYEQKPMSKRREAKFYENFLNEIF